MIVNNQEFIKAASEKNHFFFGDIGLPLMTWDEVVGQMDTHIQKLSHTPHIMRTFKNGGMALFQGKSEKLQGVLDQIASLAKPVTEKPVTAHIYLGISSISQTLGKHQDVDMDVFIWQQIGRVDYIIEDTETIQLHPGDMLYIPKGVFHEPVIHTPRVTVSIAIEH